MPKINSKLTGTAGEHFVAYKLSCMGFVAAIPREGAPTVDILACNTGASRVVSIQVKTTDWSMRTRGRGKNKQPHHLEFPLGHKAASHKDDKLIFTFVDLKGVDQEASTPDVYVVPSAYVYEHCKSWLSGAKMVRFHVPIAEMEQFKNNWQPIISALNDE